MAKKFLTSLFLVIMLVSFASSAFASINSNDPVAVIQEMVNATNNHDIQAYIQTYTKNSQSSMQNYLKYSKEPFFREKAESLAHIKELPGEEGKQLAGLDQQESSMETRIFYVELKIKVDEEDEWLFNGINHRIIIMALEDGNWRIVRVSVPSISDIVNKKYGFNTPEEKSAVQMEETLDKKGQVINYEGKVIKNLGASQADLEKERDHRQKNIQKGVLEAEASSLGTVNATAADEHTRPADLIVYFNDQYNINYWGGVIRATIDLYSYVQDVLPNEWYTTWYATAPTAVRAGALAVKMYAWYAKYHPKWMSSPWWANVQDSTADQLYVAGTRQSGTTQAINDVDGIGMDYYSPSAGIYKLYEVHYMAGTYGPSGQYSGRMYQQGTKYWADQGQGYTYMCHYYYDYGLWNGVYLTENQPMHFFYY